MIVRFTHRYGRQPVPLAPPDDRRRHRGDGDEAEGGEEGGESGEEALAPATTYAAVFGTTPIAVAKRKGSQPQRDTAAQ